MEEKRITNFADFWPFYMSQHTDQRCRALHYVGSLAVLFVLAFAWKSGQASLVWLAIPVGYGPAWIGHFVIEKNRPATFQYPFYSLLADYVMLLLFLSGRLQQHIKKNP